MEKKGLHRKGSIYAWLGFLLVFPINIFVNIAGISALNVLYFLAFLLLAYGCWLELASKNRHWAWLFLLLLYVIGAVIIFALKDRSVSVAISQAPPQSSKPEGPNSS
jgi:hypothetical protein